MGDELYDYDPGETLTAGDLRRELAGVPDDAPVVVYPAVLPGLVFSLERQVAVPFGDVLSRDEHTFAIRCDFPAGEYFRRGDT